jgi:hypothetical protein
LVVKRELEGGGSGVNQGPEGRVRKREGKGEREQRGRRVNIQTDKTQKTISMIDSRRVTVRTRFFILIVATRGVNTS